MKYLEAKKRALPTPENKMLPGSRLDQQVTRSDSVIVPPVAPPASEFHDGIPQSGVPATKVRVDVLELADELGVDILTVTGTGAGGQILIKDVRAAHKAHHAE